MGVVGGIASPAHLFRQMQGGVLGRRRRRFARVASPPRRFGLPFITVLSFRYRPKRRAHRGPAPHGRRQLSRQRSPVTVQHHCMKHVRLPSPPMTRTYPSRIVAAANRALGSWVFGSSTTTTSRWSLGQRRRHSFRSPQVALHFHAQGSISPSRHPSASGSTSFTSCSRRWLAGEIARISLASHTAWSPPTQIIDRKPGLFPPRVLRTIWAPSKRT